MGHTNGVYEPQNHRVKALCLGGFTLQRPSWRQRKLSEHRSDWTAQFKSTSSGNHGRNDSTYTNQRNKDIPSTKCIREMEGWAIFSAGPSAVAQAVSNTLVRLRFCRKSCLPERGSAPWLFTSWRNWEKIDWQNCWLENLFGFCLCCLLHMYSILLLAAYI